MPQQIANGAWPGPAKVRQAFSDAENRMAEAMEHVVAGKGFAQLLGQAAENAVSLTTLNAEVWDLVLRNFRMAGRSDIHRLARRLNEIDDKLEMLLQEIERLGDMQSSPGGPA
jgi:hypothetical protein